MGTPLEIGTAENLAENNGQGTHTQRQDQARVGLDSDRADLSGGYSKRGSGIAVAFHGD